MPEYGQPFYSDGNKLVFELRNFSGQILFEKTNAVSLFMIQCLLMCSAIMSGSSFHTNLKKQRTD